MMNLGIVKILRRLNAIKELIIYIFLKLIVFLKYKFKNFEINIIRGNSEIKNSEIVFLGNVDSTFFQLCNNIEKTKKELGNPEAIIFLDNNYDNIKFDLQKESIYRLISNNTLICISNAKIGCAVFDLNKISSINELHKEILIRKRILKNNNANVFVAYIRKGNKQITDISSLKKIIGRWGFDIVIGTDTRIKGKRDFRTIIFGQTRVLYSLGEICCYDKIKQKTFKHSVAYKIAIDKYDKKCFISKEGYIPLIINYSNGINNIEAINKNSIVEEPLKYTYYLHMEKVMKKNRRWEDMILLSDVFDVLDINMPSKYSRLSNYSVNQICARTFEVAPGNIFFYRRQFNDKNDKKLQNEFLRLRLILRAYIRQSLFIFSFRPLPRFIPHVVIADPTEAHIKLMSWYKKHFIKAKFIGVTGSIGKTSTKDMIYHALKNGFETQKNVRNTNVQVKIGINMQRISSNCEVYIQEIGGGRPGGASRHSRMILPDVTVITNIGTAHIGNYDSQEDLMNNKLGIIEGMPEGGSIYLNADDDLLRYVKPNCRTVFYALKNKNADFYAENIVEKGSTTEFNIVHEEESIPMCINVIGEHNVLNAVCAFAIAKNFGMKNEDIQRGMKDFRTEGIRQNVIKIGKYILFMDCYNASLESVESSLETLEKLTPMKKGKRIAILGDITGTGEMQEKVNEKVAYVIDKHSINTTILYGKNANSIKNHLKNIDNNVICISKQHRLENWMRDNIKKGDVVLFKGSSKLMLDEIVDNVFGLNTADERYIDEAQYIKYSKNAIDYRIFHNYASIKKYRGSETFVKISDRVAGKKIKKIWRGAFANNKTVENIKIGKNVRHIGSECFYRCESLKEVMIPEDIKFIGKKAFSECNNLQRVFFKGKILFLNKNSFENCNNLQEIILTKENFDYMKVKLKHIKAKKLLLEDI